MILVDIDVKKDRDGVSSLRTLLKHHGTLPNTLRAQTASGGLHVYFRAPQGVTLYNINDHPLLGNGIEMKCDTQYLVAPPSTIGEAVGLEALVTDLDRNPLVR